MQTNAVLRERVGNIEFNDAVELLNISNNREHLSEEEFLKLLDLLKNNVKNKDVFIRVHLRGYKETLIRYKTIFEWEDAKNKILIKDGIYTNLIYYNTMILCRRLKPDYETLNLRVHMPYVIGDAEKNKIKKYALELKYANSTIDSIICNINKMVLYTGKNISELTTDDILEFREHKRNDGSPKSIFYVLKSMGNFDIKCSYNAQVNRKYERIYKLKCEQEKLVKVYSNFKDYIFKVSDKNTALHRELNARIFINWLWDEYREIEDYDQIESIHIKNFALWIKTSKVTKKNNVLAESTINGRLTHLKNGFLVYLKKQKILSNDLQSFIFGISEKYSDLYYPKGNSLPFPIPMEDRKAIEASIYSMGNKEVALYDEMFKLLYLLGLRPSELISLKLDCIRGTDEVPKLYIHRAKKYKERYIPLTEECLLIILKLQEYNKYSPLIYLEYDGETSQRLFHYQGVVSQISNLEDYFSNLLVSNSIVNYENKAKYTLYVLRRIRITTWLEGGLSEDEVAYLVGHSDVDSHNSYIVSKELRLKNAKKVYEELYEDFFEEVKKEGKYVEHEIIDITANSDYIEEIKNTLLEIEKKNINITTLEMALRDFPEYALPLPCGFCLVKAFQDDFECEMMKLPCLECVELMDKGLDINKFDEYLGRIFKSRNIQQKKGVEGLVNRSNTQIDKLKKFYELKFNMSYDEVNIRFKDIEKDNEVKRGRKKTTK